MHDVQTKFPGGKVIRERYIVDELLGQGGFGTVYRVRDRRVKNNVFALKEIIDPNRRTIERFILEGELLRRLDHPHLPRVYRVFADEKHHRLYMLMDYVDGSNLEHLRVQQPKRRFSFTQTLKIMAPIIEAVIYLHSQTPPIIHRDIKPANIIVLTSGEGAVLVDFGIAKEYDLNATTTAIRHCSPSYGAPEQYICDTNLRTDIYGLGATFYTLLTGEVPIDALYRITSLSGKGTDLLIPINDLAPEIPTPVVDIVQRALAINSNERFASVEVFWEALIEYAGDKVTDSLPFEASLEGIVGVGLAPTHALHSSTDISAIGNGLALLPTVPPAENLFQPRQAINVKLKDGRMFLVSLIILALSAGAIFATGLRFSMRHLKKKVTMIAHQVR